MVWSTNFGKMIGIFYCGRYENQFCLTAPYKLWIICQSQIQQKKISIQKGLPSCKIVSTLSNNKNMARVVHNKPGSLNRMLDSIDASHSTWNKNMGWVSMTSLAASIGCLIPVMQATPPIIRTWLELSMTSQAASIGCLIPEMQAN